MDMKEWRAVHPKRKFYSELVMWLIVVAVLIYDFYVNPLVGRQRFGLMLIAGLGWLLPAYRYWKWCKYDEEQK